MVEFPVKLINYVNSPDKNTALLVLFHTAHMASMLGYSVDK